MYALHLPSASITGADPDVADIVFLRCVYYFSVRTIYKRHQVGWRSARLNNYI